MEQASLELLIPETKIEVVEKALQKAFNITTIESIMLLAGGYSGALVYKITVSDKPNETSSRITGWEA